jgi:glycosyltransferase involved in cell wall biosynthesis
MINILYIHQSADLYGSDKALLSLINGLDKRCFNPVVLLPCQGPLVNELHKSGIKIHILPLAKISRKTFSIKGIIKLPFDILKSIRNMNTVLKSEHIDIVHTNTLAVLGGAFWTKLNKIKHIWHVHEIISKPYFACLFFTLALRFFATKIICNSYATRALLLKYQPALKDKIAVIWNGIEPSQTINNILIHDFRQKYNVSENQILITLVGRYNRWKGQLLLLKAAEILFFKGINNVRYLFVGSPPSGMEYFKEILKSKIDKSPARDLIIMLDFQKNIQLVWASTDISVVPSTEPEPFGYVAVEAMAARKPVIAANHGGLAEIVVDDETGLLFYPENEYDLADKLLNLITNKHKRIVLGENGYLRFRRLFMNEKYLESFNSLYTDIFEANEN